MEGAEAAAEEEKQEGNNDKVADVEWEGGKNRYIYNSTQISFMVMTMRSDILKEAIETLPHRALLMSAGLQQEDLYLLW
jgi:hypothetical protein